MKTYWYFVAELIVNNSTPDKKHYSKMSIQLYALSNDRFFPLSDSLNRVKVIASSCGLEELNRNTYIVNQIEISANEYNAREHGSNMLIVEE
ncbi:MAG: hypothetical protein ACOYMB_01960 [Patescibacteria group bacterium]